MKLSTIILVFLVCAFSTNNAQGAVTGKSAIAFLNDQRRANNIPPITRIRQAFAAAWCPNEDTGPSGGETFRVLSTSLAWSRTSSPWDAAPLHQFALYYPLARAAGDTVRSGRECAGLGDLAPEPTVPTFYAFLSDIGAQNVPPDETVENELPFAPQQLVGIPQGRTTGPQPILYALGMGDVQALHWSLRCGGRVQKNVRFADARQTPLLSGGGVMIPPVLTPHTRCIGSVVWENVQDKFRRTQRFAFTTGGANPHLRLEVYNGILFVASKSSALVHIHVYNTTGNLVLSAVSPPNNTWTASNLKPGNWRLCLSQKAYKRWRAQSLCEGIEVTAM